VFDPSWAKTVFIYIPISFIGLWRWSYWIARRIAASMYKPEFTVWPKDRPEPTVSLVTPVYNEDPATFEQAMQSWIRNGVSEIIAVIDKTNTRHIVEFERKYVTNKDIKTKCRMIVTPKPGKRAALCDGIERAKGDLIVLVDSDTIWDDHVLEKSLPHFLNEQVGGTTVTQRINNPNNTANVMFDMLLWTRYKEEVPFLLGVGKVFNTLSGRTAFYRREALLNPKFDNLHKLRHEFFLGTRGVSGDDKRLTHLILEQGWHLGYVLDAAVYTPGLSSVKQFMKQRLRWTRNSWRADLRALARGWVWKHPALGLYMLDHFFQPFVMLLGPIVFALSIANQEWLFAGILLAWWVFSRVIRLFGYFKAYPKRLIYLPPFIVYGYVNALVKIYALGTLVEHSWATRWHKSRMKTKKVLRRYATLGSGIIAIGLFLLLTGQFVIHARKQSGANVSIPAAVNTATFAEVIDFSTKSPTQPKLPETVILPTGVERYVVQPGDTLGELATRFNMTISDLKKLNGLRDPDVIGAGQILLYYRSTQ
jgi:hyaluronan synthase